MIRPKCVSRWGTTSQVYTHNSKQIVEPSDGPIRSVKFTYEHKPEHGNVIGSRPSDNKRRVRGFGNFGHFVNYRGRFIEPNLRYSDFILKFEITTGFRFGHKQQIVEQKQMAFLTVHTLQQRDNVKHL